MFPIFHHSTNDLCFRQDCQWIQFVWIPPSEAVEAILVEGPDHGGVVEHSLSHSSSKLASPSRSKLGKEEIRGPQ